MELSEHLTQLLALEETESLFLSVYLDTSVGPAGVRTFPVFLRKKISLHESMVEHRGGGEAVREYRSNVSRIEEYLTYKLAPETRGCALFSNAAISHFQAIQLPLPFANRMAVSTSPNLYPLIELQQNRRHYAALALDQHSARIFSLFLEKSPGPLELSEDLPGRSRAGGWSQMRYQRHRKDLIEHFMRQLAERLGRFLRQERPDGILLFATQENLNEFMRHLSLEVRQKVICTSSMPARDSEAEILKKAEGLIQDYEKERESELLSLLYERLCQDYRAVVGPEDTLFALQAGRLERLFVTPSFRGRGLHCSRCDLCFASGEERCKYCQGGLETVDLRDRVEKMAAQRQVPIQVLNTSTFLDSLGGTGAFLRY